MALPASIEASLSEAGFSATEILILNRLLTDDTVTLRLLAMKTGKSTGVLDQAMKKLLKKRVVAKEDINEAPRYTLDSMHAVLEWMEKDMQQKRDAMARRHENLESFIATLAMDKIRPEIQHFYGEEGIRQAYVKMLEYGTDMLVYQPTPLEAEDDPLHEFRVQHFRMRRQKGIFSRVIAHDTPLGRRYQSRDVFEYRKSLLLPESALSIPFEKMINGDVVTCIDHEHHAASMIRYPHLAATERATFEAFWKGSVQGVMQADQEVPLKTKILSHMRDFFLSKTSIATFVLCAVTSGVITGLLYWEAVRLNTQRIQDKVRSIAATGALQFTAEELAELRGPEDMGKPVYRRVIQRLNDIKDQNDGVKFAYVMRATDDAHTYEWIADASSLNPELKTDLNFDGLIDERDKKPLPGDPYDSTGMDDMPRAIQGEITAEIISDQWGTFISGLAPVYDAQRNIIALFGVDVYRDVAYDTINLLSLVGAFFGFFFIFAILRFIFLYAHMLPWFQSKKSS